MDFKVIKKKRTDVNIWGFSQICLQKMDNIQLFDDKRPQTSILKVFFYAISVSVWPASMAEKLILHSHRILKIR